MCYLTILNEDAELTRYREVVVTMTGEERLRLDQVTDRPDIVR
jgi:hypothetical protein